MSLDYETLKVIWWVLVAIILIMFILTDGFDMGVGILLPFMGKTDEERRIMLNTVAPHWEGNQTWLVAAGGAIFAAWPLVYSMAFSGFYVALLITLFALFFRPVGFDYRSKLTNPLWRGSWDWGIFIGSFVPALIFGVAFGNLLQGVPFHYGEYLRPIYTGTFWQLLNPFAILTGVVSVVMIVMHGATWLQTRTVDALEHRASQVAKYSAGLLIVCFAAGGIWVSHIAGFEISAMPDANSVITPDMKTVITAKGAWLNNYTQYPLMILAPALGFIGMLMVIIASHLFKSTIAFIGSALALTGVTLTAGLSLFPFIMPSSGDLNSSLTIWDAVSSELTMKIMFWIAIIMVPIILIYTLWNYIKMWQRLNTQFIRNNDHSVY